MHITNVYAIAASGALATLVLIRLLPYLMRLTCRVTPLISKHLTYPYFLDRHQLFGPWTRAGVLIHLLYVLMNVFCLCFPVSSTSAAGRRAGTLSLVNMAFLFAGAHLSFVADLLGVSLRTCRRIHCAAGWMASALLIFHVLVVVFNRADFPIHESNNLFAIIGAVSLGILLLTFLPLFQRFAYEIFLRIHQALAGLCIYAIWRHLPSDALFPRLYVYIMAGVFLLTFILQSAVFFYRNGAFGSGGCPRALITHDNNAIKICVVLSRPMKVDAGQYINLWIPNVSFWSWVQSHPFVITSWSRGKQNTLDLFVEPRRGLSADLLRHARADSQGTSSFLALFSGPHGITESVANYESVVTVASGFGIAAVIPYLKQLIFGYNTCTSRTRRVHLVWELRTLSIGIAAQPLLNNLLDDDILDDGYILTISIYLESGEMVGNTTPFGDHERAQIYNRPANFQEILQEEVSGEHIKRAPNTEGDRGELLVMVSASDTLRDHLRGIVRGYLYNKVRMLDLDYQPA